MREGADAVGSSYLPDTTACEPPPFDVRSSEFRAPSPIVVVGVGPATERARRRLRRATRGPQKEAIRARSLPWGGVVGFALGATVAATAGLFTVDRGLEAALLACVVAGTVTLAAALGRRRGRR